MSRLGAGCRQKPSSKAGSKQGGIISNSSTSKTKPSQKKQPAPATASVPPHHLQRQAGALTATLRSRGWGTRTGQHLGPHSGLGPHSVPGRGAQEAGAAPTGRAGREVPPAQGRGGSEPCRVPEGWHPAPGIIGIPQLSDAGPVLPGCGPERGFGVRRQRCRRLGSALKAGQG